MSPMISRDTVWSLDGPLHFQAESAAARPPTRHIIAIDMRKKLFIGTLPVGLILLLVGLGATSPAEELQTWKGRISDSMCGVKHEPQEGNPMTPKECTLATVKGGSKFVFVLDEKV